MEELKYPITIKKKNSFMISVGIAEIVFGLVWVIPEGIKSLAMWIFVVTGIITLLSVWVEYSRDIKIGENKVEFYKNKELTQSIKYSEISNLSLRKGEENKEKNKKFLTISFSATGKKKDSKSKKYDICTSEYSLNDLAKLRDTILKFNKSVKVSTEVKEIEITK